MNSDISPNADPLISVIIPVYKVEDYLGECLESVISQTYQNLEILLVDDGSPDRSPEICDDFAKRDSRIQVIHKENGGLSSARNAGLELAKGDYVGFVDSDDLIDKHFYEALISAGADIAQCAFRRDKLLSADGETAFETITGREMLLRMCSDADGRYTVVWNKLWKRELLNGNVFPEGKQNEDEFFSWKVYEKAGACAVCDTPLYFYRKRSGSIMEKAFSIKQLDFLDALKERVEMSRNKGDEEFAVLTEFVYCHRLRALIKDIKKEDPQKGKWYSSILWTKYRRILFSKKIGVKKKISLSIQMVSPQIYRIIKRV